MKKYYRFVRELKDQLHVSEDIEIPGAECVVFELKEIGTKAAGVPHHEVTFENGRTIKVHLHTAMSEHHRKYHAVYIKVPN